MRLKEKPERPWSALGMSRATWYRRGKPTTKRTPRLTMASLTRSSGVSLRTSQRTMRVMRSSPELTAWVRDGQLTIGEAEKMLTGPPERLEMLFALTRTAPAKPPA